MRRFPIPPLALSLLSVAIVLAVWSVAVARAWVPVAVLPSPDAVVRAAIVEIASGRLASDIGASFGRLATGYAIGAGLGVLIGLIMGAIATIRSIIRPWIEILRPIPPLAWIPVAMIWFGIGEGSKVFLIAMTAFFPIAVATLNGVIQTDGVLLRAARSLDADRSTVVFRVILPAAMPDVVTGLRLGWTLAITILVGSEMIAANSGVGRMIIGGMNQGRFDLVILGILLLGTLGMASDTLFARLSRLRLLRWHAGLDKASG